MNVMTKRKTFTDDGRIFFLGLFRWCPSRLCGSGSVRVAVLARRKTLLFGFEAVFVSLLHPDSYKTARSFGAIFEIYTLQPPYRNGRHLS